MGKVVVNQCLTPLRKDDTETLRERLLEGIISQNYSWLSLSFSKLGYHLHKSKSK